VFVLQLLLIGFHIGNLISIKRTRFALFQKSTVVLGFV